LQTEAIAGEAAYVGLRRPIAVVAVWKVLEITADGEEGIARLAHADRRAEMLDEKPRRAGRAAHQHHAIDIGHLADGSRQIVGHAGVALLPKPHHRSG